MKENVGGDPWLKAMITLAQFRNIQRRHHVLGGNITMTALKTGHSPTTVLKYTRENLPPKQRQKPRTHRTRTDPLADEWPQIEARLALDPGLEAKTLLEHFQDLPGSSLRTSHLRTLQRRIRAWHRLHPVGEPEVFFPQHEQPGHRMQLDWTCANHLGVTIQGAPLPHLLCHAVLTYSNQAWAERCQSESMLSLKLGLVRALGEWGGRPAELQTDHSSVATHQIQRGTSARAFNPRYQELCLDLGLSPRAIEVGTPSQNGDIESANGHFKNALDQALLLRGSREFAQEQEYDDLIAAVLRTRNRRNPERWAEERLRLHPLPASLPPLFDETEARVTRNAVITHGNRSYSAPSRLIGERLRVHLYEREVVLLHHGVEVARHTRLAPAGTVDWKHVITALCRKPGAFARYAFREQMFPGLVWRRRHERWLALGDPARADREHLLLLKLALHEGPQRVEALLLAALDASDLPPTLDLIKAGLGLGHTLAPLLELPPPDLSAYDHLLEDARHAV